MNLINDSNNKKMKFFTSFFLLFLYFNSNSSLFHNIVKIIDFNNNDISSNNINNISREIMIKVLNYNSYPNPYITLGGLNNFINISIDSKGNFNVIRYTIPINNDNKIMNEKCLNVYKDCNYYTRIVIENKKSSNNYFVCMFNKYKSVCFYYNTITNSIDNKIYINNLDPFDNNYIFFYSELNKHIVIGTKSYILTIIYPNNIINSQYKKLNQQASFIYGFEYKNNTYLLFNELNYIHKYFSYFPKITHVDDDNNNNDNHNNTTLNCSIKIFHDIYSDFFTIYNFPIITSAKYSHQKKLLYVTFIDKMNIFSNKYNISTSTALCIFKFNEKSINPNGLLLLIKPNCNIISIEEIDSYLYILYNDIDNNNSIIERYSVVNNNKINIKKEGTIILPFLTYEIYIIKYKLNNLLFTKHRNKLIFFNISNDDDDDNNNNNDSDNNNHHHHLLLSSSSSSSSSSLLLLFLILFSYMYI